MTSLGVVVLVFLILKVRFQMVNLAEFIEMVVVSILC